MSPHRPKLLFVAPTPSSFVRDDLSLLSEDYDVRPFFFGTGGAAALARGVGRQARWLAEQGDEAALVYGWFADYPLALPTWWARRRGVPVAVALGGFDAACLPELEYGVYCSRWRGPLARYVLREASLLLPVASALVESENAFATALPSPQGVRVHVPDLTTPVAVVPTGYDPSAWPPGAPSRDRRVVTAALVGTLRTYRLKGIDLLADAARQLPDVSFEVIGVDPSVASAVLVPDNLALRPPVARDRLVESFQTASVVAHLSRSEGLPNALCEAMLCGCVPVVSRVGGMPEAAEGVGEIVGRPDGTAIADALRRALAAGPSAREEARRRIEQNYSRAQRRDALLGHIAALVGRPPT